MDRLNPDRHLRALLLVAALKRRHRLPMTTAESGSPRRVCANREWQARRTPLILCDRKLHLNSRPDTCRRVRLQHLLAPAWQLLSERKGRVVNQYREPPAPQIAGTYAAPDRDTRPGPRATTYLFIACFLSCLVLQLGRARVRFVTMPPNIEPRNGG
jgi:hypothetical protein